MKTYICELILRSGIRVTTTGMSEDQLQTMQQALAKVSTGAVDSAYVINTDKGVSYSIPWNSVDLLSFIEVDSSSSDVSLGVVFPDSIQGSLHSVFEQAVKEVKEEQEK